LAMSHLMRLNRVTQPMRFFKKGVCMPLYCGQALINPSALNIRTRIAITQACISANFSKSWSRSGQSISHAGIASF